MLERVTWTKPPSVASSPFNEVGPAIQDPDGEKEGTVTFPVGHHRVASKCICIKSHKPVTPNDLGPTREGLWAQSLFLDDPHPIIQNGLATPH